jgi:hypothetical protein
MGWIDYYRLYVKYNGDLSKATKSEMGEAARANPNDPPSARALAKKKWDEYQAEADAADELANREMYGDECDYPGIDFSEIGNK